MVQSPNCVNPDLMGFYATSTRTITVCKENAQKRRKDFDEIVKHEFVHFVYDLKGPGFSVFSEADLTNLVRETIPSEEALFVIIAERQYQRDEEFTARILSQRPNEKFVNWARQTLGI